MPNDDVDKQKLFANNEKVEEEKKETVAEKADEVKDLSELKDKYLRLYAEFENYKKQVNKNKEELIKYSNEALMKELLPVIDHLELALEHSSNSENESMSALIKGIEITLKELKNTLEKFGLVSINIVGKPFDPFLHHAMAQITSNEHEENTVVQEFRKGYMLKDRVLRASLVGVSKKLTQNTKTIKSVDDS